jgi:PncC family amidohydrolase
MPFFAERHDMSLADSVALLARALGAVQCRIVFAESCTGGLIAASLAEIPGISDRLCGSFVTYRSASKHAWLGVPESILLDPGPVSEITAKLMALGALERTSEADFAASITGHLGPGAPPELDGTAYCGIAKREAGAAKLVGVSRMQAPVEMSRVERQRWVAEQVCRMAISSIER